MSNTFFAASSTAASHFFKALPWAAGTALVIGKVFPTNRVHTISQMARAAFGGALLATAFIGAAGRLSLRGFTPLKPFYETGLVAFAATCFVAKLLPKRGPPPVPVEIVAAYKQLQDVGVWVVRPNKVASALDSRVDRDIAVLNIDCNHIALYRYGHQPEHGHPYDVDRLYVEKQDDGSYMIGYYDGNEKVLFPIAEAKAALEAHFGVRILDDELQKKLDEEADAKAKAFVAAHPNWEKEQEQKLGIKIVKRAPVKTFQMVKDEYNLKEEKLTYPRLAKIAAFIFGP